jgi:pyruvate, orthophosphate dikinase
MQARAIFRAGRAVRERTGRAAKVEIMIPLVAYAREFEIARDLVLRVAEEEGFEPDGDTQTGLGFSRDDIEAAIVPHYVAAGIVERSLFATQAAAAGR